MVPYNQMKANQLPPFIQLKNADGTIDTYYSIFYDGVSNEIKNIARTELNETEENKKRGIQRLREVLKEEGITGVDDLLLLCCLRKCKYNFNKAESQVLKYLKSRDEILEKLRKADLKRLEHVLDHMVVGLLPYRDKKGRAIFFTTPNINLQLFDLEDAMLCYFVVLSFILNSSSRITSITGVVYIGEVKTPSMDIMYPIMKTFRRELGRITSFPGRIAKIEILNEISIVRWTVNLIKHLLPTKSVERKIIHVYVSKDNCCMFAMENGTMKHLYKTLQKNTHTLSSMVSINFYGSNVTNMRKTYHPDLLPEEFGGTMGPLCNTFYKEEILNFIKKLRNENTIGNFC